MTKESLERLLVDYGVSFTSALADRLLQEFNPEICEDAISREEAIEIIAATDITNGEEPVFTGKQVIALLKDLDGVISSRPTEPCEDAISRQAAVERLCKVAEFMNEKRDGLGSPYVMAALFIQDNKEEFPSVTPKQRTGHWIKDDITERSKGAYKHKCDRCGAYHRTMYDYCPSCGAKMIEPQESEEQE